MKQTYRIKGIKCMSCIAKITDAITKEFLTTDVEVLNKKVLTFNTQSQIDLSDLNILLSRVGDYRASESLASVEDSSTSSYRPIYIIFAYLIFISILLNIQYPSLRAFMANFMAGFFLVFSFFKMLDLPGFAAGYANYDLIAKKFYPYGYIYPFIELSFGASYLVFPMSLYLNFVVFIVMLVSTLGVVASKFSKRKFHCACVGTFLKVPLGNIAIIEDLLMVAMSLFMLLNIYYT